MFIGNNGGEGRGLEIRKFTGLKVSRFLIRETLALIFAIATFHIKKISFE